jgi:pSer/pThr/pTyr-binding forkhead associated (FHA) protein
VTLIGSQRKAHIVLHDPRVSRAHCAMVNTGQEVLLFDLHSAHGTRCNGRAVDLVRLAHGDVVVLGDVTIHIGIAPAGGSAAASVLARNADSVRREPIVLADPDGGREWCLTQSVALIGCATQAAVVLTDKSVGHAHALVARLQVGVVVFDLGSPGGTKLDGLPVSLASWPVGATLQIGPHRVERRLTPVPAKPTPQPAPGMRVSGGGLGLTRRLPTPAAPGPGPAPSKAASAPTTAPAAISAAGGSNGPVVSQGDAEGSPEAALPAALEVDDLPPAREAGPGDALVGEGEPNLQRLSEIDTLLGALRRRLEECWREMNDEGEAPPQDSVVHPCADHLSAQRQMLDRLDAALRGQLHDLTDCCAQLAAFEQDLANQAARIHEERLRLFRDQASWAKRKAELTRRAAELDRRERLLQERTPATSTRR